MPVAFTTIRKSLKINKDCTHEITSKTRISEHPEDSYFPSNTLSILQMKIECHETHELVKFRKGEHYIYDSEGYLDEEWLFYLQKNKYEDL